MQVLLVLNLQYESMGWQRDAGMCAQEEEGQATEPGNEDAVSSQGGDDRAAAMHD